MGAARGRHPSNGHADPPRVGDDWRSNAACRGMTVELFFKPADGETSEQRRAREAAAKAICEACPVRIECLDHALATDERYGIWGGTTAADRRRLVAHASRAAG